MFTWKASDFEDVGLREHCAIDRVLEGNYPSRGTGFIHDFESEVVVGGGTERGLTGGRRHQGWRAFRCR